MNNCETIYARFADDIAEDFVGLRDVQITLVVGATFSCDDFQNLQQAMSERHPQIVLNYLVSNALSG